jgi:hypothetical protein
MTEPMRLKSLLPPEALAGVFSKAPSQTILAQWVSALADPKEITCPAGEELDAFNREISLQPDHKMIRPMHFPRAMVFNLMFG